MAEGGSDLPRALKDVARRAAAGALALVVAGCAALSQMGQLSPKERARGTEPMLAAAGFRMMPADSQRKLGQLKELPQLSVKYYADKEGRPHYWMADADFCRCLYVGGEEAYQQYQNLKLQQQMAEEQQQAAEAQMQAAQQQQMMMTSPFMGFGGMGYGGGFGGMGFGGGPGFGFFP